MMPAPASGPAPRCLRHSGREAVARCPGCGGAFCRECVVEHSGRILCATCLAKEAAVATARNRPRDLGPMRRALALAAGMLALWFFFDQLGEQVRRIPMDFGDRKGSVSEAEGDSP